MKMYIEDAAETIRVVVYKHQSWEAYTKKMRLINGKLWSYLSKIWLMRRFVSVLIDASSHDKYKS